MMLMKLFIIFYNYMKAPAAPRSNKLRQFDRTLFTNKATFGFVGGGSKSRDLFFNNGKRCISIWDSRSNSKLLKFL